MILDFFFHILNFSILGYLVVRFYQASLKNRIHNSFIAEQLAQNNLLKQFEQLKKDEQVATRAYYHQASRYEELSHKIMLWRKAIEKRCKEQLNEQEAIRKKIEGVLYDQQKTLDQEKRSTLMRTRIVDEAARNLSHWFSDSTKREDYNSYIISCHKEDA